ncbi:hypothetical protein ACTXG6_08960 [Pseudonocardia sp. Cha107L01]|uniref:hypothetical protein n=1 Tax=Pseudonocardia sp. Cha107L01 TaxID=3457576 RepID=UPI00403E5B3D
MTTLSPKWALVTGADRGIGRGLVDGLVGALHLAVIGVRLDERQAPCQRPSRPVPSLGGPGRAWSAPAGA